MKTIYYVFLCIFVFMLGVLYSEDRYEKEHEKNKELTEITNNIVKYSDKVMYENDLYDICGSDNISLYLQYCDKLDSLYKNK